MKEQTLAVMQFLIRASQRKSYRFKGKDSSKLNLDPNGEKMIT